jgi:hypothetical protein
MDSFQGTDLSPGVVPDNRDQFTDFALPVRVKSFRKVEHSGGKDAPYIHVRGQIRSLEISLGRLSQSPCGDAKSPSSPRQGS